MHDAIGGAKKHTRRARGRGPGGYWSCQGIHSRRAQGPVYWQIPGDRERHRCAGVGYRAEMWRLGYLSGFGFIHPADPSDRLVANGEAWVDQKVIQLLAERYPSYENRWVGDLTERDQTVLQGVIDGLSNRKIGDQNGVSESTVKAILQRLFTKAGVRTRSQLVRIALEALPMAGPATLAK